MSAINLNGQILQSSIENSSNRGFLYGDGLFETFRMFDGCLPFLPLHFNRLKKGMEVLGFNVPLDFEVAFVQREINKLLPEGGNHRIRFNLFRKEGGLYTPSNNDFEFRIESNPLENAFFPFPDKGMEIGWSKEVKLLGSKWSSCKTLNALPYVLAAQEKVRKGWDDILIPNHSGDLSEANSSNVWIWDGSTLKTPPLESGCVAGVMRAFILQKFKIEIGVISKTDVKNARSILLTNSIQGIRWVSLIEGEKKSPPVKLLGEILIQLHGHIRTYKG